jgi:hypothetical protein
VDACIIILISIDLCVFVKITYLLEIDLPERRINNDVTNDKTLV